MLGARIVPANVGFAPAPLRLHAQHGIGGGPGTVRRKAGADGKGWRMIWSAAQSAKA